MHKKHKSAPICKKKTLKKKKHHSEGDKDSFKGESLINEKLIKSVIHNKILITPKKEIPSLTPKVIRLYLENKYGKKHISKYSKNIKQWSREIFKNIKQKRKEKKPAVKQIVILKKKKTQKKVKEINPKSWILPSRKSFPSWINTTFRRYRLTGKDYNRNKDGSFDLFPYQKIIKDYLSFKTPYRGLLLYHGLGAGKTCSSIAVAEGLKNDKQIIVMLPASLETNYLSELKHCADPIWKLNQHWVFTPTKKGSDQEKMCKEQSGIDLRIIRKNGGCWLSDTDKKGNYGNLSTKQKEEINKQLDYLIKKKYKFIHYNGLQGMHLDKMESAHDNPFNNKVIVIDEIHNLISRVVGGGSIGKRLYKLLMDAENIKLVLLSGTPLINYPYEIGFLINLLRGYIDTYQFKLTNENKKKWNEEIKKNISKLPEVDQVFVDVINQIVTLTRNPSPFINDFQDGKYLGVTKGKVHKSEFDFKKSLELHFAKHKQTISNFSKTANLSLPNNMKEFDSFFINAHDLTVKNSNQLKRRMIGLISYYKGARADLYPKINKVEIVKAPMSNYQFEKYEEIRQIEREKERKKNRFKKDKKGGKEISSYYRVFSRAFGNFVFPESIERPLPGRKKVVTADQLNQIDAEQENELDIDVGDTDYKKQRKQNNDLYEAEKKKCLKMLFENKERFLVPGKENGLQKYSNKFTKILQNIQQSPGSVFVYSQFRSLEGIEILSTVLNANGYAPFKIKKNEDKEWEIDENPADAGKPKYSFYTGTEGEEMKIIIKNIFNNYLHKVSPSIRDYMNKKGGNLYGNVIKVLLATSSAAEGIHLENVRQVHITEPYWNPVRTDQVMGRAIRINSHINLPLKDRNVDVFMYLSTFRKEDLVKSFTIRNKDKSLTSDEAIYNIAEKKRKITTSLITLMKEVSIDCTLFAVENEPLNCFTFGSESSNDSYSTVPNINDDYSDAYKRHTEKKLKGVVFRFPPKTGILYVLNPDNKNVYDYDSYKIALSKGGRPIRVGKLVGKKGSETVKFS